MLKHPVMKIQPYLMPNEEKMKKEECQLIFKLRIQVSEAKINQKTRYENYECEACGLAEESQSHVLNCEVILEMNNETDGIPKRIMNGSIKEQFAKFSVRI